MTTETEDRPVISALTEELIEVRKKLRALSLEEKELKREKEELSLRLIQAMDAVGTTGARALGHSLSIQEAVVPQMTDYDTFCEWFIENIQERPELVSIFERRLSAPVFRELLEEREGEDIPGLFGFTRRTLSLRSL